jgi:hypothetical protein
MGRGGSFDRRQFVVRGAVAAGAIWTAPAIRTVRLVAAAGSAPPDLTGSSTPTTTTITVPPLDVLVTGGGFVEDHERFGFNARARTDGTSGELNYTYRPGAGSTTHIHSVDINSVEVDGDRATILGTAKINDSDGFTFRVDVVDGAPDRFAIVIRATDGTVFHQAGTPDAPVVLGGGSIQIH